MPPTGKRKAATVSSNSRVQAARPATDFSCSSFSISSRELIRAEGAQVAQPGRVTREFRRLELAGERRVLEAVELEGEEQQQGRDGVDLFLHVLEEAAVLGAAQVGGIGQAGIAQDPAERFLQPLVFRDRPAEIGARQRGELALIATLGRPRRRPRRLSGRGPARGCRGRDRGRPGPSAAGAERGLIRRRCLCSRRIHETGLLNRTPIDSQPEIDGKPQALLCRRWPRRRHPRRIRVTMD